MIWSSPLLVRTGTCSDSLNYLLTSLKVCCVVPPTLWSPSPSSLVDLSPSLVGLLSRMMHPDPKERPTVDQVLSESALRWEALKYSVRSVCSGLVTGVRAVLGVLLSLVTLLSVLLPG